MRLGGLVCWLPSEAMVREDGGWRSGWAGHDSSWQAEVQTDGKSEEKGLQKSYLHLPPKHMPSLLLLLLLLLRRSASQPACMQEMSNE